MRIEEYEDILDAIDNNLWLTLLNNRAERSLAVAVADKLTSVGWTMSRKAIPMLDFFEELYANADGGRKFRKYDKFVSRIDEVLEGNGDGISWKIGNPSFDGTVPIEYGRDGLWPEVSFEREEPKQKSLSYFRAYGYFFNIKPQVDFGDEDDEIMNRIFRTILPNKENSQLWEKCLILFDHEELEDLLNDLTSLERTWPNVHNVIMGVYKEFYGKRNYFNFMPDMDEHVKKYRQANSAVGVSTANIHTTIAERGQALIDSGKAIIC